MSGRIQAAHVCRVVVRMRDVPFRSHCVFSLNWPLEEEESFVAKSRNTVECGNQNEMVQLFSASLRSGCQSPHLSGWMVMAFAQGVQTQRQHLRSIDPHLPTLLCHDQCTSLKFTTMPPFPPQPHQFPLFFLAL